MAAIGDMVKLTAYQQYLGQSVQNAFFYRIEDAPSEGWMEGLVTEFIETVASAMLALQSSLLVWERVDVVNIFDLAEIYSEPYADNGSIAATSATTAPSYMSWTFQLIRSNARVRNGRKSVGGLVDTQFDGNSPTAGTLVQLNTLATAFAATLEAGVAVDSFAPVIIKRVPYTTSEGNPSFRLPESAAEMGTDWAYVNSSRFSRLSTMNSRKAGRGI